MLFPSPSALSSAPSVLFVQRNLWNFILAIFPPSRCWLGLWSTWKKEETALSVYMRGRGEEGEEEFSSQHRCLDLTFWVQQKNRHFMMSTTVGIWACAINTNAPRPARISKVCGLGGAPCFSKRPWNVPPSPGVFLGPQRPFGVRTAQREVLPEEVIPFRWKNMNCFMGDRNLGQASWVNPSASSCGLSLFAALRYLTSADDFSCVKSCWMLYAARAASELLPRRGWV